MRSRGVVLGVVIVGLLSVLAVGAVANAQDDGDEFFACANANGKIKPNTIRLNTAPRCSKNQTLVSWNAEGRQGIPGPQGEPGPQGPPGTGDGLRELHFPTSDYFVGGFAPGSSEWVDFFAGDGALPVLDGTRYPSGATVVLRLSGGRSGATTCGGGVCSSSPAASGQWCVRATLADGSAVTGSESCYSSEWPPGVRTEVEWSFPLPPVPDVEFTFQAQDANTVCNEIGCTSLGVEIRPGAVVQW